jgi:hypothetical protein
MTINHFTVESISNRKPVRRTLTCTDFTISASLISFMLISNGCRTILVSFPNLFSAITAIVLCYCACALRYCATYMSLAVQRFVVIRIESVVAMDTGVQRNCVQPIKTLLRYFAEGKRSGVKWIQCALSVCTDMSDRVGSLQFPVGLRAALQRWPQYE